MTSKPAMRKPAAALCLALAACAHWAAPLRAGDDAHAAVQTRPVTRAQQLRDEVRVCMAWDQPLAALAASAEAVAREPDSAGAWSQLAVALFRNADMEGAEAAARRALKLNHNDPDGHVVLARCLDTKGENDAALEHLEEAVRLDPFHPAALRLLSSQLDHNEDRARIVELSQRYVELKLPGPSGHMFTQNAQKSMEVLKALGETATDVQPDLDKRPASVTVKMDVDEDQPTVQVDFSNGVKSGCLFDTGEESITLSPETVAAIGAKKIGALPAATATGLEMMDVVLVPELKVGGFVVRNSIAGVGTGDIIGPSVFHGYRVKMDFARRQLVLTRQPEDCEPSEDDLNPRAGDAPGLRRVRFRRHGGLIWIPIQTPDEAAPLKARGAWGFLDTGCQPPGLLMPRYLQALKSEPGKGPLTLPFRSSLGGAARDGKEEVMRLLPEFRVGLLGGEVRADKAISSESLSTISQSIEAELDMIVGWPMILKSQRAIEVDFERCVLTLEPRETKKK
ncbi:MAG: tetratricopeptide repeat protein [Planctomycetota bacterium]|nr:tetratricopeptide repeat protein [Planctomycetota bacterium]